MNRRGSTMIYALLLSLIAVPLLMVLSRGLVHHNRFQTQEKRIKNARTHASNLMYDVMEYYSEDMHDGHYLPMHQVGGTLAGVLGGNSSLTVTPQPARRTVALTAQGTYGPGTPTRRTIDGLVCFKSDYLRFTFAKLGGGVWNPTQNLTVNGVSWLGGGVSAGGTSFTLSTTVVLGNVNGANAWSGRFFTPAGNNVVPSNVVQRPRFDLPSGVSYSVPVPDEAYYYLHASTRVFSNFNIYFSSHPNSVDMGRYSFDGFTWIDVSSNPYAQGTVIYTTGVFTVDVIPNGAVPQAIRGKVLIVALEGATVRFNGNMQYQNSITATGRDSFGVIASQISTLGVVNQLSGMLWTNGTVTLASDLTVQGAVTTGVFTGGDLTVIDDPALRLNPPPMVPERPILAGWHIRAD